MYRVAIAIVDATRARLFRFDRTAAPEGLQDQLVEVEDLVDPARRLRASDLYEQAGRADDHRDHSLAHLDTEFARLVVASIGTLVVGASRLILCASPRMLGRLRELLAKKPGMRTDEVARDLVKLTPAQLREQLSAYGLLPAPRPRDLTTSTP